VSITATQPETIYVQLERTIKAAVEVTAVLQDLDLVPPGYAVDTPELNPRFVTVEGPFSLVEQVATAVVKLSLADRRQPIAQQMEPQLLDDEGAVVRGVKLSPGQVSVSIGIEQKLNYREVAVRGAITGQPARGYYVSSVEVDPATITVVGPPAVIAEMPGLVSTLGEIDVTGETRLQYKRLRLDLPPGVTPQDGRTDVLVTVGIDPIMSGMNVAVPLEMRRVPDGLQGTLGVPMVEVYLTGPAVLLDELQVGLLEAYVDLNDLNAGLHQLKPVVNLLVAQNLKLTEVAITSISPAYVAVELVALPTPTPTVTPTPTPTETPSPAGTMPGPRATPTRTPVP
jgi:YbbR domain-containing protein